MPIRELQIGLREVGRIRSGDQVPAGKGRAPRKLDRFRFTADDPQLLGIVSELYGGTVERWDNAPSGEQWEVYVTADRIPVMVIPQLRPLTQWFETWSGGGCQRRCDGERELLTGQPCVCLATNDRICKPTTRLNVVLPELPGIGTWRLESHGWYAARELGGTVELITRLVQATQETVHATLRLTQRTSKVGGQTRHYAVPVLDVAMTVPELLGRYNGAGAARLAPEPARSPVDGLDGPRLAELATGEPEPLARFPTPADMRASEARSEARAAKRRTPPMGPGNRGSTDVDAPPSTINESGPTIDAPPDDEVSAAFDSPITSRQSTAMLTLFRKHGIDDRDERLMLVAKLIGHAVSSSKELTVREASVVLDTLTAVDDGRAEYVANDEGRIIGARPSDPSH